MAHSEQVACHIHNGRKRLICWRVGGIGSEAIRNRSGKILRIASRRGSPSKLHRTKRISGGRSLNAERQGMFAANRDIS